MVSRKKRLKGVFDIQLTPTAREKLSAKIDAQERLTATAERLTRQRKKQAARDAAVDKAEEIKERAKQRREQEAKAAAAAAQKKKATPAPARTACTCRKPRLDRGGKCSRCHKAPAGRSKGFWG